MSYNKKVWKSGDRITKEALNNMENGIEAAHQNSGGTGSVAIVDNLNSNSSTSALSAKQGKELNNKMPAKSIVEGGKIYLAKEDGTKLDSGTELPAGGTGTSYDDTEIKTDINTIKTDLGTEELTTTAKTVKGAVNEVAAQYKEIANNQPTDLSLDSATNLLQLVNSKGSKLGNGITLPISSGGGTSQYLHIKYSSTGAPQLAGQISDTPNAYIGLCVDTNADSPTNPKNYTWYNWKGDNGDTGATPNLQIGTVTTLESGSNATASITGTTENPLLNLGIPKGAKGDKGDTGASSGATVDTLVTTNISGTTLSLTTDKYQTTTIVDGTEITLPTVTSFKEIHLFFNTATDLTLILPSCKWQNGNTPTIVGNKTYEFIFTYTTEWLGGVIAYE